MIGQLPTSLYVNGNEYKIRSDYRVALVILQALNDVDLSEIEQAQIIIECLFEDDIPTDDLQDAMDQAGWFLNCGAVVNDNNIQSPKLYDWEQDEQLIFSAVNKVSGQEVRALEYLHWWSFIGLFNEIGEGTFSTIVSIRDKKNKHKKLEKWEQEFCRKNPDLVKLRKKLTAEEIAENEFVKNLLKGGKK